MLKGYFLFFLRKKKFRYDTLSLKCNFWQVIIRSNSASPFFFSGNFPGEEVELKRRCKVAPLFMILGKIMPFHEKYSCLEGNVISVFTPNTVGGFLWNINICKFFM